MGDKIYRDKKSLPLNQILSAIEKAEGVPMHAPYHHSIVPYALLVSAAIEKDIEEDEYIRMRDLIVERGKTVPGGFCGNCGACGSSVGVGIFVSVFTGASPMTKINWQWANEATAHALLNVAKYPGPRCCKRTCYLSIEAARDYVKEVMDLDLPIDDEIICDFYPHNKQCIGKECPYFPQNH